MAALPLLRLVALWPLLLPGPAGAAGTGPGHLLAIGDYQQGKVLLLDQEGRSIWEYPAPCVCDLALLGNGNLLFTTHHGVLEVTRAKQVAFRYQCDSEVYSCQRLADGTTLVGETTRGALTIVDAAGKVLSTVSLLQPGEQGGHGYIANVRQSPGGHFLVAMYAGREVREYDAQGRILARFPAPGGARAVVPLTDGSLLISTADKDHDPRLRILGADGAVRWEVSNRDLPGQPLRFACGVHRLANGNILVANFLGHGQLGTAPHLLEITPDKQVAWTWADHGLAQAVTTVQVLDAGVDGTLR